MRPLVLGLILGAWATMLGMSPLLPALGNAAALKVQFQQFDGQFEKVPDGQIRCLIILPKPMVDAIEGKTEHAQVAMSGYPAHDSRLILTCEVVSD